jgi:hypothetical protein
MLSCKLLSPTSGYWQQLTWLVIMTLCRKRVQKDGAANFISLSFEATLAIQYKSLPRTGNYLVECQF